MIADKDFYSLMDETTNGLSLTSHFVSDGMGEFGRITGAPLGEYRHFIVTDAKPGYHKLRSDTFVPCHAKDDDIRAYYDLHLRPSVEMLALMCGRLK